MTLDEAKKVAAIIGTADDGCPVCVRDLVEQMQEAFPEFTWKHIEYEEVIVSAALSPPSPRTEEEG